MNVFKILLLCFSILLSFSTNLLAEKVEIISDSMHAKNIKKQVHFIGNVKIKQMKNWLHAKKVIVYFDDNNKTKKYDAIGAVKFEIYQDKSQYNGKANNVTFFPKTQKYILTGNAVIDDKTNKRHITGSKIVFDSLKGNASVKGKKNKPVKFTFDMGKK